MTGRLEGKVALVTGAARGQGRSHAIMMAAEGADIIAVDLCRPVANLLYQPATPADLEATAAEVRAQGRRIITRQVDTRDFAALEQAAADGVAELGHLDICVANAGICVFARWDRVTPEIWRDTLDINLTGTWNTARAAAPHMVSAKRGSLILVSSVAGLRGFPLMSHYVASKHGITGLARALAVELSQDGIRVNSIHPCGVNTEMASEAAGVPLLQGLAESPRVAPLYSNLLDVPMIEAADVSAVVVFLASDESRFVTGSAMTVDAGNTQH